MPCYEVRDVDGDLPTIDVCFQCSRKLVEGEAVKADDKSHLGVLEHKENVNRRDYGDSGEVYYCYICDTELCSEDN